MIGKQIGPFEVQREIGRGAMGIVYQGTDSRNGRIVAIKVLQKHATRKGVASDRFKREATILHQFRHAHIVRLFKAGIDETHGLLYFAMEYVDGGDLEGYLHEKAPMPWIEAVGISIQICSALQYAHHHGVFHRDIKPSNIMINPEGQIKLTDFGIARMHGEKQMTEAGKTLGTCAYMSPEQIRNESHDSIGHKTDLYALGVILFQMLTGRLPFQGQSMVQMIHAHLNEPAPRASQFVQGLPVDLDRLVSSLLAKDRKDRPWDAADVEVQLTDLRNKALRGDPIDKVSQETLITVDSSTVASQPSATKLTRKTTKEGKAKRTGSRDRQTTSSTRPSRGDHEPNRESLTTAGIITAIVALLGLTIYLAWPLNQDQLYVKAEALNRSADENDWIRSIDILDQLEERFPNHAYQEEVQGWRDRLAVRQVERRARYLVAGRRPKDDVEQLYADLGRRADEAERDGKPERAAEIYGQLVDQLQLDDPGERPWRLLAEQNHQRIEAMLVRRDQQLALDLDEIETLLEQGQIEDATKRFRELTTDSPTKPDLSARIQLIAEQLSQSPDSDVDSDKP